jgi:hypothetical protein
MPIHADGPSDLSLYHRESSDRSGTYEIICNDPSIVEDRYDEIGVEANILEYRVGTVIFHFLSVEHTAADGTTGRVTRLL